tara:strand:- start:18307 stop:18777 length:471 start_codon:yes stop_codon:yes gene_type:complete
MSTRAQKETELTNQYFNGQFSDDEWDCSCSGNIQPTTTSPGTPVTEPINPFTPTNPNTGIVNPIEVPNTPTGDGSLPDPYDLLPTVQDGLDVTYGDNGSLVNNPGSPTAQQPNGELATYDTETSQAGAWFVGLLLVGAGVRQYLKNRKKQPLKVKL